MSRVFDGATTYASFGSSIPVSAAPLSMACWFNTTDDTTEQVLLTIGDTGGTADEFALAINGSVAGDPVQAQARRTSTSSAASTTGYSLNTWHHACAVFNSTTDRRAFIDGGSKGTEGTSRAPTSLDTVRVGAAARSAATKFFSGSIAHAAIWNATLTDAEVAALGKGVNPLRIRPASLVFYAPLMGGSPEPDYTAGQRALTLTGSPSLGTSQPRVAPFMASPMALPATVSALPPPTLLQVRGPVGYGSTAGGYTRTIGGTDFVSGATVSFDGTPATDVVFLSSTELTCTVPAHAAGNVSVRVTNPDAQFDENPNEFEYVIAPTVTAIDPASGPTTGGTLVVLTGTGFRADSPFTITVKGVPLTSTGISNNTSAFGTTAVGTAGIGDVVYTRADSQSGTLTNGFEYTSASGGSGRNRMLMGLG